MLPNFKERYTLSARNIELLAVSLNDPVVDEIDSFSGRSFRNILPAGMTTHLCSLHALKE